MATTRLLGPLLLVLLCGYLPTVNAFPNAELGKRLAPEKLPRLGGGKSGYFKAKEVSLFVFLRPGQSLTIKTLEQLEEIRGRLNGKPLHWAGIVSDHYPRSEIEAMLTEAQSTLPILFDRSDALYGRLGVMVHPSIGISDASGHLIAYEPFRQINYGVRIEGMLQHAIGEIDETLLAGILDPSTGGDCAERDRSHSLLRMAEELAGMKMQKVALQTIERCLKEDPSYRDALAFAAALTARMGKCHRARYYLQKLKRQSDKENETVSKYLREAREHCLSSG